jgi:TonB family protein
MWEAMNASPIRGDWVGRTIDGRFPLHEWLGGSETSGVFLTELDGSQKAAIKLIPASSDQADKLIATWNSTATLSHPHLMRIFHYGRAQVDGTSVAYIVTERADEVLSQIIPERPLTPEETREMLNPVLDALSFLHGKGFVHGHLKPSNILVVNDQLKLSVDGLLAAGRDHKRPPVRTIYDAPEASTSPASPANDTWSLGITLVEILTQRLPAWDRSEPSEPVVPDSVPHPFAGIARGCLCLDPARRFTSIDVRLLLPGDARPPVEPGPSLHARHAKAGLEPTRIPVMPLVILFLVLLGLIAVLWIRGHHASSATPAESQARSAIAPSSMPPSAEASVAVIKGAVTSRYLPDVPHSAGDTIHGTIQLAVRVNVDPNGQVTGVTLASPGPSKYFARLALNSAQSWKFKPAQSDGHPVPSVWILHYRFRRGATDVNSAEETP